MADPSERNPPLDLADDVQDVRVSLDDHQLGHRDRAELRDATHVVAPEIHEHDVLRALLLVGKELRRQRLILLARASARSCTGDRADRHTLVRDADEKLRGASDELHAVEHEVIHVRRRIDCPQRAIERVRLESRAAPRCDAPAAPGSSRPP